MIIAAAKLLDVVNEIHHVVSEEFVLNEEWNDLGNAFDPKYISIYQ